LVIPQKSNAAADFQTTNHNKPLQTEQGIGGGWCVFVSLFSIGKDTKKYQ
jgi:hypothetical protein